MMPSSLLDGQLAPGVAFDNRGLSYGDGLFETVLIRGGKPLWLDEHLQRLAQGAHRLAIPCNLALVKRDCSRLLADLGPKDAILKITLTRGSVARGYSPLSADSHRIVSVSPTSPSSKEQWQEGVAIGLCNTKLARQPLLAGIKHLNRLEQVLAAGEMRRRGFVEGLVQDDAGKIIEATRSNVFIARAGSIVTPLLNDCGVDGIMRQQIILAAKRLGLKIKVAAVEMSALRNADEVFICNSVIGIWPVTKIECMHKHIGPLCRQLQREFESHFYA
ncbi:aminodeoxychorismate lyase [Zhongshania borealis]|uniref:Aminodeoxychorismate lyase n=1 Tax=Zhongshania borealis TaxID=889488 RepID=A0ABP7WBY6_9GAMM